MLKILKVENLNLADSVEVRFAAGFNVVTGETGAGKSFLIKALEALFQSGQGGKSLGLSVGDKTKKALIAAVFDLGEEVLEINAPMTGPEDRSLTGELIFEKEILASGRSKLLLNKEPLDRSAAAALFASLVDIDRQNAHTRLTDPMAHLDLLDKSDPKLKALADKYTRQYSDISGDIKKLKDLIAERSKTTEQADLYRFRLEELRSADLENSDPEVLQADIKLAAIRTKAKENIESALQILGSDTGRDLIKDIGDLAAIGRLFPDENLKKSFEDADLEMIVQRLSRLRGDLLGSPVSGNQPEDLDSLQAKLFRIRELERKYRLDREGLIELRGKTEDDLHRLQNIEPAIKEAYLLVMKGLDCLKILGRELGNKRDSAARSLEEKMRVEFDHLDLERTEFIVKFEQIADGNFKAESDEADKENNDADNANNDRLLSAFSQIGSGFEKAEFFLKQPGGNEPLPIRKAASGGEMSRILLALKTVLRDGSKSSTLLLDEADVGVSGRTAALIGRKLRSLGKSSQVIAITHLPQVASEASSHILVTKALGQEARGLTAKTLEPAQRVEELARLLSGKHITDESRDNARKLLESVES